jgi:hypothetical protein
VNINEITKRLNQLAWDKVPPTDEDQLALRLAVVLLRDAHDGFMEVKDL